MNWLQDLDWTLRNDTKCIGSTENECKLMKADINLRRLLCCAPHAVCLSHPFMFQDKRRQHHVIILAHTQHVIHGEPTEHHSVNLHSCHRRSSRCGTCNFNLMPECFTILQPANKVYHKCLGD